MVRARKVSALRAPSGLNPCRAWKCSRPLTRAGSRTGEGSEAVGAAEADRVPEPAGAEADGAAEADGVAAAFGGRESLVAGRSPRAVRSRRRATAPSYGDPGLSGPRAPAREPAIGGRRFKSGWLANARYFASERFSS